MDVYITEHEHANLIGRAFQKACGGSLRPAHLPRKGDCAFYGILRGTGDIFKQKLGEQGASFIYIDHGYIRPGHYGGYYRLITNAMHLQELPEPDYGRLLALNWEPESHTSPPMAPILLAGPSAHIERFLGVPHGSWVSNVAQEIANHTGRKLIPTDKIRRGDQALAAAHAVVTWHSNLATEAIRRGVPTFSVRGNLPPLADAVRHPCHFLSQPIDQIETPRPLTSGKRLNWAASLAAAQYRLDEFAKAWEKMNDV